jgi:hypothetical protein
VRQHVLERGAVNNNKVNIQKKGENVVCVPRRRPAQRSALSSMRLPQLVAVVALAHPVANVSNW